MNENMNDTNDTDDEVKKNLKMKKWDIAAAAVLAVGLVILYFFWGCSYDWMVTLAAVVIAAASLLVGHFQFRKIKELSK